MFSLDNLQEPHLTAIDLADRRFGEGHDFPLLDGLEALFVVGSHAYGTETAESDTDYLAIVTPRMRHIIGLGTFEGWEPGVTDESDVKVMSIAKFMRLAAQGNPNIIETLFFDGDSYLYTSAAFDEIRKHRDAFLSRDVFKRFSGYAMGQVKKMESGKYANDMGAKRKKWVDTIGYDPKDASHLARLLINGSELARTGSLTARLSGRERALVMEIKNGEWDLDRVKRFATHQSSINESWFHDSDCPLPQAPDMDFIEVLLMEIHRNAVR